jgi:MYXO-CTERM domain-containing protein
MEFALASVSSGGNITSAYLDVTRFGGQRWQGELQYRLFGYSGTGSLDLNSGLGGLELAGPFFYDIDIPSSNLIHADVTSYLRSLVTMGATHVGFSFRDTFTAPNFGTDGQYLVVQDSPFWAGDVPPKLTIVQEINPVPEPTGVFTGLLCLGLATARRRRR